MEQYKINDVDLWAYISKVANTQTRTKVEHWINSNDYDKALFNKINNLYRITGENPYENDMDIESEKQKFFTTVDTQSKNKKGWKRIFKYAAAIALIIASVTYTYKKVPVNDLISFQTDFSEQKEIQLPNGSVVCLNASSKISYHKKSPRTIYLEGEAFFEVAKDKNHPFTVETPDHVIVKALGTSFNIKSYVNNTFTEMVLLTGKVEVSSKNYFKGKLIMFPNDKIKILKNDGSVVKSIFENKSNTIVWKEGKIQFKNKSFKEIANNLKAQYNVKIYFENEKISNSKFTGSFDQTTPIIEILEILKATTHFEFEHSTETDVWIIK